MSAAEDFHRSLIETAASYLQLGWSVVPLWGDTRPDQAKVAAVSWASYQRRRVRTTDLQRWFTGARYAGLGIVTGAVSQLVVLDFDDPDLAKRFGVQHPELAATRTVLTRRGRHLYFHIPPHVRVGSRKLAGVDLLADGHYVVAPPTVINGHEYQIGRGGLPKALAQNDVNRIQAFLDRHAQLRVVTPVETPNVSAGLSVATPGRKPQEGAFSCPHESPVSQPTPVEAAFLSAEALVHFYRSLARQSKRNVALFRTSCLARDHGWKYEAVVAVLASTHAAEIPVGPHAAEIPKVRRREAERTIRSAFSKPPRPPRPKDRGGLFNSIREKLLQLGQTCVVRVLEGLRLAGVKAGQIITERTVLQLLRGLVGRHSVRAALSATTPAGKPVFEAVRSPRYPPHGDAATQIRIDRQQNAYVNRATPDKNRGRPKTYYRIPSPEQLCQRLDVAPSGSDPIARDDLQTAKATRQALHRELIRRRPGLYLRKWLGDRLGVSETTVWRYCHQLTDIQVTPTFTHTPLGWHNLNAIPAPDVAPAGTCLEDSTGKRWPAVKGIAQKLLAQGRGVQLLVRSLNYYWYGHGDPPAHTVGLRPEWRLEEVRQPDGQPSKFREAINRLVRTIVPNRLEVTEARPSAIPRPSPVPEPSLPAEGQQRKRKPKYWKPLTHVEAETLAVQVYETLNRRTEQPEARVSLATTRCWVDEFGLQAVTQALQAFNRRRGITQPAGWFKTLLRSSRL